MKGCEIVPVSPNQSNIFYEVRLRTIIDSDLEPLVDMLRTKGSDCLLQAIKHLL